jgi:hypothetical protein
MSNKELDQLIGKSVGTEPDFQLPADFASKVVFRIVRHEQWKSDLMEYLYLTGILAFLLAIVSGTYYWVDKEFVLRVFNTISENLIPVILIAFLINFILFADRVLLRLLFRSLPPAPHLFVPNDIK